MNNPSERLTPQPASPPTAQIEDYLDQLCAPMVGRMTYEQRLAIREEVRGHLRVLAASHQELGASEAEAITAAIRQFGDPKQISRSLLREYRNPAPRITSVSWHLLHALIGGAFGSLAFIAMDCMAHCLHMSAHILVKGDCMFGMALGWIPGMLLLKRPTSSRDAAKRAGLFYTAVTGALMAFACIASGHRLNGQNLAMMLACTTGMGLMGAFGGAAMSRLFRTLQRFAHAPE